MRQTGRDDASYLRQRLDMGSLASRRCFGSPVAQSPFTGIGRANIFSAAE
jgi:hypothetical protein